MVKSICLFNHKGGVSKTTTTLNLGWALAERGNKVLMVDLDSQCNLTGLVLGQSQIQEEELDRFYKNRENLTLQAIVSNLIEGISPDEFLRQEKGKTLKTKNDNLFLLSGHVDVSDLDAQINVSLKIASGIPSTRNIPGNLPKILGGLADRDRVDYVLYDLSPNVGGLNEVMLMSSDFFIVPTVPDYFCLQAVQSLKKNVLKWHKEIKRFREDNNFEGNDFPIRNCPKFIGTVQQRYRPRNEKPAKSFQKWMDLIRESINTTFVPALEEIGCVIPINIVRDALEGTELQPYDLANISDFNSLIAISQQTSKPVFSLTNEEISKVGNVFGHAEETMKISRDSFLEEFGRLATIVEKLTNS